MVRLLPWLLYSGTELRIATRSYQSLHCFPLPRVVLPILQHRKMSSQTKPPAPPRPSSSVIVISPHNEILLLHRVKTSTSFASAHVFPGGNLSTQDGPCPAQDDLARHDDAPWYRRAALRELFEESGILLAREQQEQGKMLQVAEEKRERGRRAIHQKEVTFADWLGAQNGNAVMDIDNLIPFTRWITPTNVPKRFTTQMYLYFLPLAQRLQDELPTDGDREEIPIPTSDGGVEITEARFLRASEWLRLAQAGEVMLFPPQFLLLHLVAGFLDPPQPAPGPGPGTGTDTAELEKRRQALREFVHSGSPPWTEKCISPKMLKIGDDGRAVLALDQPGPELAGSGRRGETERVVLVRFRKGEAREVEVNWKGSHSRSHL